MLCICFIFAYYFLFTLLYKEMDSKNDLVVKYKVLKYYGTVFHNILCVT